MARAGGEIVLIIDLSKDDLFLRLRCKPIFMTARNIGKKRQGNWDTEEQCCEPTYQAT